MRSTLTITATTLFLILISCRRDAIDSPKLQTAPKLKRTVNKNPDGQITGTTTYNEWELSVADSAFSNGKLSAWTSNEYNSKGKRTRATWWVPGITPSGYHWMDIDEYIDDTIPVSYRHFLHGSQTLLTKHFYDASRQLVLDSNYHTAIGASVSTIYTEEYAHDAQGRILKYTRLDDKRDTVSHSSYTYSTNRIEVVGISFTPYGRYASLGVTDYNSSGRILSQKSYSSTNQLISQTDYAYTFDANGYLIKAVITDMAGTIRETRYTNNAFGRPEKEENFYQNNLIGTRFNYYE